MPKKSKDLGGPEGGIKMSGTVSEISMDDRDEFGHVTVRHGPKPKKGKDGFSVGPYPKTTRVDLPNSALKELNVGDKVDVKVVPQNKGAGQVRV